jgi:hypothetical protein
MQQSALRLIKRRIEYIDETEVRHLPPGLRGIYVLYRKSRRARVPRKPSFDVVYVGMATKGGIRARLRQHRRTKRGYWTHFSVFEVWENIRDEEIRELEGLFRHIYRFDSQASPLNAARGFKALRKVQKLALSDGAA